MRQGTETSAVRGRGAAALGMVALAAALLAALAWTALQASAGGVSGSLTTTFASNNGNEGNTFDLRVRPRGGIDVKRLDVNVSELGTSGRIRIWTRPGTSQGFELSAEGWKRRGTAQVTSRGEDNKTPARIRFHLPKGTWGVAIGIPGPEGDLGMDYTNGADIFQNDDLVLRSRAGLGAPIFGGGGISGNRIWNGTIHYRVPCEVATKKLQQAKRQVRKAERALDEAVESGSDDQIDAAEAKLEKKLSKLKKAKRKKRRACSD
jgi:hypothetical protein